jgi:SAM-dependent methyltransferase
MVVPSEIDPGRYDFASYVDKRRMITFWYQLDACLRYRPQRLLEVGSGPGLVKAYLQHKGVDVTSVDVNPALKPDFVGSVENLSEHLHGQGRYDVALCARVLHHLPFEAFGRALDELRAVADYCVLTLPADEFGIYAALRVTSRNWAPVRLPLPRKLKRLSPKVPSVHSRRASANSQWKIGDSSATRLENVVSEIEARFRILRSYGLPEDRTHHFFELQSITDGAPQSRRSFSRDTQGGS